MSSTIYWDSKRWEGDLGRLLVALAHNSKVNGFRMGEQEFDHSGLTVFPNFWKQLSVSSGGKNRAALPDYLQRKMLKRSLGLALSMVPRVETFGSSRKLHTVQFPL